MYMEDWYIEKKKRKITQPLILSLCMGLPKSCASLTDHACLFSRQKGQCCCWMPRSSIPLGM